MLRILDQHLDDDGKARERGNREHCDARIAAIEDRRDSPRDREAGDGSGEKKAAGIELVEPEAAHEGQRAQRHDEADHEKTSHRPTYFGAGCVVIERR